VPPKRYLYSSLHRFLYTMHTPNLRRVDTKSTRTTARNIPPTLPAEGRSRRRPRYSTDHGQSFCRGFITFAWRLPFVISVHCFVFRRLHVVFRTLYCTLWECPLLNLTIERTADWGRNADYGGHPARAMAAVIDVASFEQVANHRLRYYTLYEHLFDPSSATAHEGRYMLSATIYATCSTIIIQSRLEFSASRSLIVLYCIHAQMCNRKWLIILSLSL